MADCVRDWLRDCRADVVLSVHASMLRPASVEPGVPLVADLVDEPILEAWRGVAHTAGLSAKLRLMKLMLELAREERALCPRAKYCLLSSEADARALRRVVPTARVGVLANGVDAEWFQPSVASESPRSDTLVFVGNLAHPPNVAAVLHFARRVWPLVRQARPTARWQVVGANPPLAVLALTTDPRISVSGYVADVRPYLEGAAVVVSPLVSGGGIKNKVLEPWAMRKAVVATPLGCAGLQARDGDNIVIAGDPAAFARRTLELLDNPARAARLGQAGWRTAVDHYSWDTQAAILESILARAAGLDAAGSR